MLLTPLLRRQVFEVKRWGTWEILTKQDLIWQKDILMELCLSGLGRGG